MSKFNAILASLESLVASNSWPTSIPTYPAEFKGTISGTDYLKFEVVLSTASKYDNQNTQLTGLVIIQLYYKDTKTRREVSTLADTLAALLSFRLQEDINIQTFAASLQFLGTDPSNTALSRADLSVPFTFIGE